MAITSSNYRSGPDVVVGLPVYNGEKYLAKALESLISQEYPMLTIFVSDNASTDQTEQIVRSYTARDARITYHRMPRNVGALENFRFVFRETHSEFFMWAAHDDIWPKGFVAAAVSCLADDRNAVMANSITQLIDQNGDKLPDWPSRPQLIDLGPHSYAQRIGAIAERVGWCIYGLIRRKAIAETSLFVDNSLTQDVLLTYELAASGSFRILRNLGPFQYRLVPKDPEQVASNLGISPCGNAKATTNMFLQCYRAISRSGQRADEIKKARKIFLNTCAGHTEWWPYIARENGLKLSKDNEKIAYSFLSHLASQALV